MLGEWKLEVRLKVTVISSVGYGGADHVKKHCALADKKP